MAARPTLSRDARRVARRRRRDASTCRRRATLDLPERAVQFGTGAFLRGFVDVLHRRGESRGARSAGASSRSRRPAAGAMRALNEQDGLYTLVVAGARRRRGRATSIRVVASVSRALSAATSGTRCSRCARESGRSSSSSRTRPKSASRSTRPTRPTRRAAALVSRQARRDFCSSARARSTTTRRAGVVVLPCELIEDNGDGLREIVAHARASDGELGARVRALARDGVPFCNTLVDRIVPGAPTATRPTRAARRARLRRRRC